MSSLRLWLIGMLENLANGPIIINNNSELLRFCPHLTEAELTTYFDKYRKDIPFMPIPLYLPSLFIRDGFNCIMVTINQRGIEIEYDPIPSLSSSVELDLIDKSKKFAQKEWGTELIDVAWDCVNQYTLKDPSRINPLVEDDPLPLIHLYCPSSHRLDDQDFSENSILGMFASEVFGFEMRSLGFWGITWTHGYCYQCGESLQNDFCINCGGPNQFPPYDDIGYTLPKKVIAKFKELGYLQKI